MTIRTQNEPTPCEKAALDITNQIRAAIPAAYEAHGVKRQMNLDTFTGIMAGYLENKSLRDWCIDLGIDIPEGDRAR